MRWKETAVVEHEIEHQHHVHETAEGRRAAASRIIDQLAGHASLATTQRYIEGDSAAKRKVINLI